jgi:primosomal protein N' (replication factor Y)
VTAATSVIYANIIVDISHEKLDKTFQYKVTDEEKDKIAVGMQVTVPFGKGNYPTKGYVISLTNQAEYEESLIKEIIGIEPEHVEIEAQLIALAGWMRENYGGTMNHALKTVLPVKQKTAAKVKRLVCLRLDQRAADYQLKEFDRKHNTARARLLQALMKQQEIPYEEVTGRLNVSASVVKAMENLNILEVQSITQWRNPTLFALEPKPDLEDTLKLQLNDAQQGVVDGILSEFKEKQRETYLLHGVTGSGKTAVYIELIAQLVELGYQAIVLIPEIALTFQTVERFHQRFSDRVSILNSRMSAGERYDQFLRAKSGELDVIIGPRSALFTPFSNLGIIIIDEEHETSYKSETQPRYHARETAIERARMADASVLLGSATPSMESYFRAQNKEYKLYELTQRVAAKPLPSCTIVDLREELKAGNRSILSEQLQALLEDRLQKKQQSILFLNRRGLAGFVSCRSCGHVFSCPHCDVSLNQHNNGKMVCHYCGYQETQVKTCPICGSKYVSGFKAGTQKIEALVQERFPTARVLRMDMDTTRNKAGHEKILTAFANQEADILIGTQMIVKGHDFPNVTLVGILAADLSLHSSDFHGAERTFQLLTQAAGRAGRGELPGEVIIQTYSPKHYSIQLAAQQDYLGFYEQEQAYRSLMRYPPVWHMLVMLVASKDQLSAELCAELLGKKIEQSQQSGKLPGLKMIGPTDAPVAKVKDIYKKVVYFKHIEYDMLVKIKDALEQFTGNHREFQNITIQFDFNPMNGF